MGTVSGLIVRNGTIQMTPTNIYTTSFRPYRDNPSASRILARLCHPCSNRQYPLAKASHPTLVLDHPPHSGAMSTSIFTIFKQLGLPQDPRVVLNGCIEPVRQQMLEQAIQKHGETCVIGLLPIVIMRWDLAKSWKAWDRVSTVGLELGTLTHLILPCSSQFQPSSVRVKRVIDAQAFQGDIWVRHSHVPQSTFSSATIFYEAIHHPADLLKLKIERPR